MKKQMVNKRLEQLAEILKQSNIQAMNAVKEARKAIRETLSYFAHKTSKIKK